MGWNDDWDDEALQVKVSQLLVATADETDHLIDASVRQVLSLLRERKRMDVVFVSEFIDGRREFRAVDQDAANPLLTEGASDPLEESWCQRVVDGRLPELIPDAKPLQAQGRAPATPFAIGTHISTPVVLDNGQVYGTLCCFSFGVNPGTTERDLLDLRYTARLTAQKIDRARARGLELQPIPQRPA